MGPRLNVRFPQSVWARQLNVEYGDTPQVENHGGKVWILGMKVEGHPSALLNIGGILECYGLYAMVGGGEKPKSAFVENREGWTAVPFRCGGQGNFRTKVKDTWQREFNLVICGQPIE